MQALFEQLLFGAAPDLRQPVRLLPRRLPIHKVREGPSAPQPQCSPVRVDRAVVIGMESVPSGIRHQPLELEGVDGAGVEAERVLRAASDHGIMTESAANAGHGCLHLLLPRRRGSLAPVGLRKLVRRHRGAGPHDEGAEDRPLPRTEWLLGSRLEGPEHPNGHTRSVGLRGRLVNAEGQRRVPDEYRLAPVRVPPAAIVSGGSTNRRPMEEGTPMLYITDAAFHLERHQREERS